MIPGVKISLAGHEYEIPPLTLGDMKRLAADIEIIRDAPMALMNMTMEQMEAAGRIFAAALVRNYPEDGDRVDQLLDAKNILEVMTAILAGSGLQRPGEAVPVAADLSPRELPTSTESSPPAADIRSAA